MVGRVGDVKDTGDGAGVGSSSKLYGEEMKEIDADSDEGEEYRIGGGVSTTGTGEGVFGGGSSLFIDGCRGACDPRKPPYPWPVLPAVRGRP